MVFKAHDQKIPKTTCVIAIICFSLILSHISFVNLPKSFAQTSSNLSGTQRSQLPFMRDVICANLKSSVRQMVVSSPFNCASIFVVVIVVVRPYSPNSSYLLV